MAVRLPGTASPAGTSDWPELVRDMVLVLPRGMGTNYSGEESAFF